MEVRCNDKSSLSIFRVQTEYGYEHYSAAINERPKIQGIRMFVHGAVIDQFSTAASLDYKMITAGWDGSRIFRPSSSTPSSHEKPDDKHNHQYSANPASHRRSAVVISASSAEQNQKDNDDQNQVHDYGNAITAFQEAQARAGNGESPTSLAPSRWRNRSFASRCR